jgi:hypothetical protein
MAASFLRGSFWLLILISLLILIRMNCLFDHEKREIRSRIKIAIRRNASRFAPGKRMPVDGGQITSHPGSRLCVRKQSPFGFCPWSWRRASRVPLSTCFSPQPGLPPEPAGWARFTFLGGGFWLLILILLLILIRMNPLHEGD